MAIKLYKFEKAHNYLDKIAPRLNPDQYIPYVKIKRKEITISDKKTLEWDEKNGGVIKIIDGFPRKGFVYNKDYLVSKYGMPKFHIFKCKVIQGFINRGQFFGYYYWSNSDLVTVTERYTKIEYKDQSLQLCSKCQAILIEKNLKVYDNTIDYQKELKLNDSKYEDNNYTKKTDINGYTYDWRKISRTYREVINYTCEVCNFNKNRRYIEVHHIDGNKQNNHSNNLKGLCTLCHLYQDDYHYSKIKKNKSIKKKLFNFIKHYKQDLIQLKNPYINEFLNEFKNEI